MGVKISPSCEAESGRPLLSDHTKAFQVATSGAVAELVGFCQESSNLAIASIEKMLCKESSDQPYFQTSI